MFQPAKKIGIICCNGHTASTSGGIIFAIAAAAFLVHRICSNYSSSSCACVRDFVQEAPGGAENTHWNIHKRHLCLRGTYRQFFESSFSDVNGVQTGQTERPDVEAPWNIHVLLHVRTNGDSPVSFGDDTHAVVKRPTWA